MTRPTLDRAPRTVSVPTGPLDEHRAKQLLEALGVAVPARRACGDRAAAHAALGDLGGPVAVKILDANVLHKTEIGGVHLDVRTPDDLDRAWDALAAVGARAVLVERMAGSGVDLIVGARRDPVFGPIVLLGLGGVAAEVTADVAVRLASLTPQDAAEMPDELAGVALLAGWRGGPTLDRDALATILVGLGHLLASNPHLLEIEVNPLRLGPDGLTALDAVVRTDEETDGHPDR
jgi:acetyltransferase